LEQRIKKIPLILFFAIFSNSLLAIQWSTNLERCIEKNVENIVTFKIPTPKVFSNLKVRVTEDVKKSLLDTFPKADIEILSSRTIGEMIVLFEFDNQDVIDMLRQLEYSDEISAEEKRELEVFLKVFENILKAYPVLLNQAAEDICNKQGVY
tara:strand:+ start:58 stop:513 length:456 start_codon:yes stop_codon:yes gene_type:complete